MKVRLFEKLNSDNLGNSGKFGKFGKFGNFGNILEVIEFVFVGHAGHSGHLFRFIFVFLLNINELSVYFLMLEINENNAIKSLT